MQFVSRFLRLIRKPGVSHPPAGSFAGMINMKAFLLLAFLAMALSPRSQDLLAPGKNHVEKKWIRPASSEMTWYALKDSVKIEIGTISTELLTGNEKLILVTRVKMKNRNGSWIDTSIADMTSLSPEYHSSFNSQRDMVLRFGKIVTGYYRDKAKNTYTEISDTTGAAYFDSNLYPALLGWLPLHESYKQDISIYDYNPRGKIGICTASVKEVKSGIFQSGKSGLRETWVVTVVDELGSGPAGSSTYYFDKTDRRLWKQEINAGGRTMLMQRAE